MWKSRTNQDGFVSTGLRIQYFPEEKCNKEQLPVNTDGEIRRVLKQIILLFLVGCAIVKSAAGVVANQDVTHGSANLPRPCHGFLFFFPITISCQTGSFQVPSSLHREPQGLILCPELPQTPARRRRGWCMLKISSTVCPSHQWFNHQKVVTVTASVSALWTLGFEERRCLLSLKKH